jgi:hypothetical protein
MFSGSRPAQTLQPRLRNDSWPEHSECRHLPPTKQKMVDSDLQFFFYRNQKTKKARMTETQMIYLNYQRNIFNPEICNN